MERRRALSSKMTLQSSNSKLVLLLLEEERSSGTDEQERKQASPWEAVELRSQANLSKVSQLRYLIALACINPPGRVICRTKL